MTEITYTNTKDYTEIHASGHAGEMGACAKISCLLQTLSDEMYEMLGEHNPALMIENTPGYSFIRVYFKNIGIVHEHDVKLLFETTVRGLHIVMNQFEESLTIKVQE